MPKLENQKPIIAIDIDDVLAASAEGWVSFSNKKWGTKLRVDDYNENWAEMWGVDHEEGKKRAYEVYSSKIVGDFVPYDEALPVLLKLEKQYELVIITSRVSRIRADTLEWLDRHYKGIFKEVHLAGFYENQDMDAHIYTKGDLTRKIGANYLIDDQAKHCFAAAEAGIPSILFGDYHWNRHQKALPKDVARCKNWQEVAEYFHGQAA